MLTELVGDVADLAVIYGITDIVPVKILEM
jgi:hypothetical protein